MLPPRYKMTYDALWSGWGRTTLEGIYYFTMKYQISINGSKTKPTKQEFKGMKWVEKDTDLNDLLKLLENGHTYRANLGNTRNDGEKNLYRHKW